MKDRPVNITINRHLNDSLMFDFGDSQASQRNQTDFNPESHPNTKLIAGYLDPEWTKIIKERNNKATKTRMLNQEQKSLLAMDKEMKKAAKTGKELMPQDKVLNLKMTYTLSKTLREVEAEGLEVVKKRS